MDSLNSYQEYLASIPPVRKYKRLSEQRDAERFVKKMSLDSSVPNSNEIRSSWRVCECSCRETSRVKTIGSEK